MKYFTKTIYTLLKIIFYTPNAKMAARLIFFCLNLNKPN